VLIDFAPVFVSVLGIPTSGKTCFLTSMSWQLRKILPQYFKYTFTDADPELNHALIENEQLHFMNSADQLVRLGKTELQGQNHGYRNVEFGGQTVTYIQPLIYSLRPSPEHTNYEHARKISYALCLYDNAGEHFLPGQDSAERPVTRHLVCADALMFVFDPSQHPRFREACQGSTTDPQFSRGFYSQTVRQETVLTEAMNRIRRYGSLGSHEKYDRPLVVLVNKYDAWAPRFNLTRLSPPWVNNHKDFPAAIDNVRIGRRSAEMRRLLLKYCPELVAAAEDFCTDVTYVPVSSFGRKIEVDPDRRISGVRANKLDPMWVEVPLLSILSRIRRGVIRKL